MFVLIKASKTIGVYNDMNEVRKAFKRILIQYEAEHSCEDELQVVEDANNGRHRKDVWILHSDDKPISFWIIRPKYIN